MDIPRSTYPAFTQADRRRLSQALAQARDARLYRRLQAVAEIAAGEQMDEVAKRARVGRSTVYRWIERYLAEQAPSALADERRSGRPRAAPVLTDKKLRQLLTSEPCRFGYDANTWTVPLLATHLRTQGVVISARTLRRRIRAARFRWKRPRYVYSERAAHVGAKKGYYPTVETQVSDGGCAVVHRLDAAAAVSTAPSDVGGDRHAGHGGDHRPERQARPVWHDQCANRAPDGHHRPQRRRP